MKTAEIDDVDSTADADHPMIDHVWRGRQPLWPPVRAHAAQHVRHHILSGVIAGRALARAQGRRIVRTYRNLKEKRS